MTYDPNSARKGGQRKHLIELVINQVDAHCKHGVHSATTMGEIVSAVRKFQKEMAK